MIDLFIPSLANRRAQRGATLVVTLIFLIVLALLGVGAAQNNSFQELMSGSTRDRELAFEAAEAAIADAYATRASWQTLALSSFNNTGGLYAYDPYAANTPDYWNNSAQWGTFRTPSQSITRAIKQPQYRIERLPNIGTSQYYRVTARGFGASGTRPAPSTIVILQAEYRYTP